MAQSLSQVDLDSITDLVSGLTLCSELGLDCGEVEDLDEIKLLIRSQLRDENTDEQIQHNGRQGRTFEQMLQIDDSRLTQLLALYKDVHRFLSTDNVKTLTFEELEQYSPGFMKILTKNISDLKNHECPIVIAGETSAGKTTLLNLLLGNDVLPKSVLHTTSCLCHIKNAERKTATLVGFTDTPQTFDLDTEVNLKRMEEAICQRSDASKEVFITWPIPMLKGHVSIVDTPGVGENAELTSKVMDYLQRAAAFIYVVNSANAGGVQKDRLIKMVKRQCSNTGFGDHLQVFNPSSAIFVLNKWDTVPERENKEVTEKIFHSLRRVWHGLDSNQLYKLNAKEAARCLNLPTGAVRTEKFAKLWKAIEELVPTSLEVNSRYFFDWLWKLLKTVQKIIYMRIANAKETQKEKRDKESILRDRLTVLQDDSDNIMAELNDLLTAKSSEMVDKLHEYLHSSEVVARLTAWDDDKIPKGNDIDVISYNADVLIKERIVSEFMEWKDTSNVFDNILSELLTLFKQKFKLLDEEFSKWEKELDFCTKNDAPEVNMPSPFSGSKRSLFGRNEQLFLGLTSPLWAPLALVAGVVLLPVIGGLALRDSIVRRSMLVKYKNNEKAHMHKWTLRVLDEITKPVIKFSFVDSHMRGLWEKIDLLKQVIPRQLEADNQLIVNVLNDVRSSKSILHMYSPLQKSCKSLIAKCRLIRLQYFDPDKITLEEVEIEKKIDHGTYADVFSGYYSKNDEKYSVAIKVMREQAKDKDAKRMQAAEVDILRNLQHENVVYLHGVVCEETPVPCFYIVMELCVGNLKNATFDHPERTAAKHAPTTVNGIVARNYFKNMMTQILNGLDFIHNKGYVHRDIKLSNILLTENNVVKISDVGMTAFEFDITTTLCGTWSHVAPEVIEGRNYRQSADIYSLGIMMWELWYGVSAYSKDIDHIEEFEPVKLLLLVASGTRPGFTETEVPNAVIKRLIEACWEAEPSYRPTASKCLQLFHNM